MAIFIPNAIECHSTQQFIQKLYIKELCMEGKWVEQHRLEEIEAAEQVREEEMQKNGVSSWREEVG